MRTTIQNLLSTPLASVRLSRCREIIPAGVLALIVFFVQSAGAFPVITSVVETGGDNEATDTIVAKWTGVTYNTTIANEPILNTPVGTPYTVGPFGNHSPAMVDRAHRYTNASDTATIPSYLLGGEYIMNGNDNRDNASMTMDVTVNAAVRVYLLIDNRLGPSPNADPPTFDAAHMQWVVDEGWVAVKTGVNRAGDINLPDEVGIDESADGTLNQWFSVYTKDYPAGTFRLKQADNAGQNMYGAVVTAAPRPFATFVNVGGNAIGTSSFDQPTGTLTIVGGGNDIWDQIDEFSYAYDNKVGDFDVRVRVESLTPNARWSKAGLMVRESLAEDSRMVFLRVTPQDVPTSNGGNGANDIKLGYRTGAPDVAGETGGNHEDPTDQNPPPYPNAWLRLVRSGNTFSAYISNDGSTWGTAITSQDTGAGDWTAGGGPFRKDALVGLAVSRHSGGPSATAVFHDISFATPETFGMVQASSRGNPNAILVSFSQAPDAATLLPVSFDVLGIVISSITPGPYANSYWLNVDATTPLVEGTTYTVTAFSVTGGGGTLTPSPDTDTFVHGAGYESVGIHVGHNKEPVSGLGGHRGRTAYQRGLYSTAEGEKALESNTVFEDPLPDNGSNERFTGTIFGLLNVTTAGSFQFACSSDDFGELMLSSDDNPANKRLIAREPVWNGSRQYAATDRRAAQADLPQNTVRPNLTPGISLAVGQYYLEFVYTEGGGGNNGSAAWAPTGTAIPNGATPIDQSAFAPSRYFNGSERGELFRTLGPVTITRQPATQTVVGGNPVTFSVGVDGTPAYRIQWQRNGQPIAGANGPTYTIPVALAGDDGARFRATVANEFSSALSAEAVLTVNIPTPPVALSATPDTTFARVTVKFDKRVQLSTAQATANYTISGGVAVNSATVDASGSGVVLATSPLAEGATYTLTVRDVREVTGNNALTPNPTTLTFQTLVFSPGFALKEYYQSWSGGAGSVDAFIAAQRAGTTPVTRSCYVSLWQQNTADEYDNYGGRISGFFVPNEDGPHVFYIATDDFGRLFLSTDDSPANLVEIAREPVWSGRRTWVGEAGGGGRLGTPSASGGPQQNISGPINLLKGHRYYMESFFTEGGGGDNMAVAVKGPSAAEPANDSSPITSANLGTYASPMGASATITQQPVDVTRAENTFATFTAAGTASSTACSPGTAYQWFRNGTPILGATSQSLTYGPVTPADNGSLFKLRVAAVGAYADSAEAMLTVVAPQPLRVVRAEGVCNLRQVRIVFDQFVDPTTSQDVFNYSSDSFGFESAVRNADNLSVTLTLDPASPSQTPGANYCVRIAGGDGGVKSTSGLGLVENPTTVCFPSCVVSCGFALQEIYMGIGGVNITDLTGNPAYPNSPNITRYVGALSANNADEFDNYGTRISGWIIPPVSGPYNFFLASDDGGDFYMSTDADPANLRLVATEPVWNPRRAYLAADRRNADPALRENRSTTLFPAGIELVAGQQYYFEARMKEGGGGDNLDVAWQIPGGPVPTDGSAPISGAFLASLASPAGAVITITQQPVDLSVPGCDGPACFTVAVTAANASGNNPAVFYQWERSDDGGTTYQNVLGANSAQFCFTPTTHDNGAKFRARVYISGATTTSDAATLTVTADLVRPQIVSAVRGASPHNAVRVTFSEAIEAASANNAANYSIDNGVVVTGAALGSDGRTVVLSTATDLADGTCYSLSVGAVLDGCANPVNGLAKITLQGAHAPAPGDPNNMIVIEAEDFDAQAPDRGRSWVFGNAAGGGGFSGTGYVADLPNGGATVGDTDLAAERVDYVVNLPVAGTWYVWARARSPGGQGNSCHIGIDGTRPDTGYRFGNSGGWNGDTWQWDFALNDNAANPAQFTVATAGVHTFNIWSREDGLQIDKILLIPVAGIPPGTGLSRLATILGPAATPREISIPPPTVSITSPSDGAILPACEPATICADPRICDGSGRIVSVVFLADGQPIGVATTTPWCITVPAAAVQPGNYTLTARATDSFGLTGNSAPVLVHVVDAPPVIICPGDISDVRATSPAGAVVNYTVSSSDSCGPTVVVCTLASGSTFPIGTTDVTCTATDGAGNSARCGFKVTVIPDNRPPTAVISSEQLIDLKPEFDNPVLLSCNWWNACLVADGWSSSDPEGGDLTYLWFADQDPVPFGAGPVVTNCLEVGTHTISLLVTDPGGLSDTDSKIIEVVTAPLAIDLLIEQVETANKSGILLTRKITRELTATLRVALSHAGREELRPAQQALDAFEKKVRAQVVPIAPDAAAAWIRWSQAVSAGMEKCIKPPRKPKHDDDPKDPDPKDPPRK